MSQLVYFRQGILPMMKKVLRQELNGWQKELVNTMAVPLTFFLAFGLGLRNYIGQVEGVSYLEFLAPGLMTMTMMQEAYRNGAWSLWLDRWHLKVLDEYRIKPIRSTDIIIGQIFGGFSVALIKGFIVTVILLMMANIHFSPANLPGYLMMIFPGCVFFTSLGSMVGTTFSKPDNIGQSQTIFITPMLYLGGLFFPLSSLPDWVVDIVKYFPTTALFDGGRNALLHGVFDPFYTVVLWLGALLTFALSTWWFNEKLG